MAVESAHAGGWSVARRPLERPQALTQPPARPVERAQGSASQRRPALDRGHGLGSARPRPTGAGVAGGWPGRTAAIEVGRAGGYAVIVALDAAAGAGWALAVALDARLGSAYRYLPSTDRPQRTGWARIARARSFGPPPPPPTYQPPPAEGWTMALPAGYAPPYVSDPLHIVIDYRPPRPAPWPAQHDSGQAGGYRIARRLDRAHADGCGPGPEIWGGFGRRRSQGGGGGGGWVVVIPGRHVIPWRFAYVIVHDIRLYRVSDGVALPCNRIEISASADQWADTLSARVYGDDAMDLLTATDPLRVRAEVNGDTWEMVVASPRESLVHGGRSVSLTGYSLSRLLDAPYQEPADYTETAARTVAQLAEQVLPTGWSLVWELPTWLVPAGVHQYQGLSPAQVVAAVVRSVQGVIRPGRAAQTLTVRPRWPVPPWLYASASANLVVQSGLWRSAERARIVPAQANAVYVQGGAVGGVLARVYRDGSAGDWLAPAPGAEPLITHADAARALGTALLAGQHTTSGLRAITLECDGDDWPLAEVGHLLEVQGVPTLGSVRDTVHSVTLTAELSARGVDVSQTLGLGTAGELALSRLRRVTTSPRTTRTAVVLTDHTDGTVTVQYPGGGRQRVRGEATAGATVWVQVQDGRVDGAAPAMALVDVAV